MEPRRLSDTEGSEEGSTGDEASAGSGLEARRGIDLGGLLGGLLGGQGAGGGEGGGLGGLLGALMGGGDAVDLSTVAPETGLSTSTLQAIIPLILGALGGQGHGAGGDAGATRVALADLAEGKAGAADALAGTGLLQQIMHLTGLNQKGALGVIMAVLKALGLGKTASGTKPKPRPKPSAPAKPKPKPKPKPSASAAKPKPRPSAHAASSKPKPKPKPASHTTGSKPKPKPRPKRSGEIDLGDAGSDEPAA